MDTQSTESTTAPAASQRTTAETSVDCIVIGSGFGGAATACRLAQAGFSVLILERGRRYGPGDFPPFPDPSHLLPDTRRWLWGPEAGLWDVQDLQEVVTVQAAGYGGGSLVYANVHLRPPSNVFDERWPEVYRGRSELDPYYDLAASMLEVSPIDAARRSLPKVRHLRRVATELGRDEQHFYPPLAISWRAANNAHGVQLKACNDCGACSSGCSQGAKNTLDHNYLVVAERFSAQARTQAEVKQITPNLGGYDVLYRDHLEMRDRRAHARYVFVCAGAVHTARLLAQLEHDCKRDAESRVGTGYFPGGDALAVVFDANVPLAPSQGPAITTSTVHWQDPERGRFFLLQDGGYAAELEQMIGMLRAPLWVGRNRLTQSSKPLPAAVNGANANKGRTSPTALFELRSMADQLLDAISSGDLAMIATPTLQRALAAFLEELKAPLMLPELVDKTIESMLQARYARHRWLKGDTRMGALLMKLERHLISRLYGGGSDISTHVAAAFASANGLSRTEWASRLFGYASVRPERRLMLLTMGRDAAPGVLHYDPRTKTMVADLDLYHLVPGYTEQEQLMSDVATKLDGELRVNPAWAFLGKPITVHNQGGAAMSDDEDVGVTDPDGQVRGYPGLYVMDASLFCTSVGVNPSATILALAERNVLRFIRSHGAERATWPQGSDSKGAQAYRADLGRAAEWKNAASRGKWAIEPPAPSSKNIAPEHQPLGIRFEETMEGHCEPLPKFQPLSDEDYLASDVRGRPDHPIEVEVTAEARDLALFIEDQEHSLRLNGVVRWCFPGEARSAEHRVTGTLKLFTPRRKSYGIEHNQAAKLKSQNKLGGSAKYQTVVSHDVAASNAEQAKSQYMRYDLEFLDRPGIVLHGYKHMRDRPGIEGWRDVSCLFFRIEGPDGVLGAGAVRVDLIQFLRHHLPSMRATGCDDPVRSTWALARFATFFFGSLQRIYFPEVQSAVQALFGVNLPGAPSAASRPMSTNTSAAKETSAHEA